MKLTSRIGETKSVSQVKEQIVDVHLDYIEKDGYVWRYNEDTKKYYNTGICLMGKQGNSGPPGRKGDNGLSAYQIAREHGFDGNVQAWLDSLKGKSAYEIAVENGYEGTEEEWLDQIGEGKSAYQIWQEQSGNENKSVSEFLAWMKDTSSMIGPKYAATTNDCVMVNNTPTLYYVPNGTTFNVYLADFDGQGVNAHSLAIGVPGDITNYAGIYDVSQDKAVKGVPATYGSLSEALGAITEDSKKKGGMTIKFIQGTDADAKYLQYRLLRTTFPDTFNESDWQSIDNVVNKYDDILPPKSIDLSKFSEVTGGMGTPTTWLNTISFDRKGKYVKIEANATYRLLCNNSANYAFMSTNSTPVKGGNMPLVAGGQRESIAANVIKEVKAPSDAEYIYIQTDYLNDTTYEWSITYVPQSLTDITDIVPKKNSSNLISSGGVYSAIEELGNRIFPIEEVDLDTDNPDNVYVNAMAMMAGKWSNVGDTNQSRAVMIIPVDVKYYYFVSVQVSTNYAFLTNNNTPVNQDPLPLVSETSRYSISANDGEIRLTLPQGTKFLGIVTKMNNEDVGWAIRRQLKNIINNGEDTILPIGMVDLSNYEQVSTPMDAEIWKGTITSREGKFIPVRGGEIYKLTATGYNLNYAFLKSDEVTIGANIQFCTGTARDSILSSMNKILYIPYDCKYLCIVTYFSSSFISTPILERITNDMLLSWKTKAMIGAMILANSKSISDSSWRYAFGGYAANFIGNVINTVYEVNTETTGDATTTINKQVLSRFNIENGDVENSTFDAPNLFVSSDGVIPIQGYTRAYNSTNDVVTVNNEKVVRAFTCMGNAVDTTYSFGWRDYKENSNKVTRCTLTYSAGGTNYSEEFTIEAYRAMLFRLGFTNSVIGNERPTQDNVCIFKYNDTFYTVLCGYHISGERIELPLVLLSSNDMKTWSFVMRVGDENHIAQEIKALIYNDILYVIYRADIGELDANDKVVHNHTGNDYYRVISMNMANGEIGLNKNLYSLILSLPAVFEFNGDVYFAYNGAPTIFGDVPLAGRTYPDGRNQLEFYKVVGDDVEYCFSIENPCGINYPVFANKKTYDTDDSKLYVPYLDRVFMVYSDDKRYIEYRKVNGISVVELTPLFVK